MNMELLHHLRGIFEGAYLQARVFNLSIEHVCSDVVDSIIYSLFWDYESDMPTVDVDLWERFVNNTVQREYEKKVAQRA